MVPTITCGSITGLLLDGVVYIVWSGKGRPGGSNFYAMIDDDRQWWFCCGCCNANNVKHPEVLVEITTVVEQAKACGITKVVYRNPVGEIAGLPVEDVENHHVGDTGEVRLFRRRMLGNHPDHVVGK